ncbi:unnamed protein product [Lactuca saligna]|uniref:WPP domain-associated protein n=1 Tax=Lactuca saligna TaxID=75948 RepID=A0AA35VBH7_LACSI|nr:unnamed protein product [Lactuca saligna]
MESQEMAFHSTDGVNDINGHTSFANGFEPKQASIGVEHSDSFNVEFLEDLDSMMEDIDNRLRVARVVSDSVIKGMVSAVEQEAEEKIKAKDLELAILKRSLQFHNSNGEEDQNESWLLQGTNEQETSQVSSEDAFVKDDELKESLVFLRNSATDEFKKLRKQIEGVKGCKLKRNGSCHEIVGLGGILKEEKYENGVGLEKTVDNLEMVMNNACGLVDKFSKTLLSKCQQEHELKRKLEDMVMQTSIRSIWDQNMDLAEKFSNISLLRNELDALTKLLPHHESGNLLSHGSFDFDNTHGNSLRSQLSSRWEESGKSTEGLDVPDSFDAAQLSHMNKEQLVKFFNNTISKMKREHESEIQKKTEAYISLKGKYLSERRSFVLPKEFETLKRKIPEVVSKLDGILSESDEFPGKGDSVVSIDILNKTLNTLLGENNHLKDALIVKNDEVKHLESQLSSSDTHFQKMVKTHESLITDACIEASIVEDVYKCVVGGLNCQFQDMKEESEVEIIAMHDIYEALLGSGAEDSSVSAVEDTFMEYLFMEELLQTVFKESLTDAEKKIETLHEEYISINKKKAKEREVEMILEGEERAKLVEEKGRVERELTKAKEQFELALNECNNLRKQANLHETLMLKKNKEVDEINDKFSKAQEKILSQRMEINSLKEKVDLSMKEIKALNDYKIMVLDVSNEKQSLMSLIEMKEKEHRKQMEAIVVLVDELSSKIGDFERRVTWDISDNNKRLEKSRSELSSFIKEVSVLKKTGILYKQKFETKCNDLQMAEDEVDLLGDEVETLLGLLEKIYIALDHYSPVLQHYSGVIEILELVRRELSGESLKAH